MFFNFVCLIFTPCNLLFKGACTLHVYVSIPNTYCSKHVKHAFQQAVVTPTKFVSALKCKCTVKIDLLTLDLKGSVLMPEQHTWVRVRGVG